MTSFRARLTTRTLRHGALEVTGQVTPYELETLALSAQGYPVGSSLEVTLAGGSSGTLLRDVWKRFARLSERGIEVTVRRSGRDH